MSLSEFVAVNRRTLRRGDSAIESVRELTAAIASGDSEAMARLFDAWFEFAFNEARRCTGRDEHFCLDVVQDAMIRIIKRLPVLETNAMLAAWIRTTVRSAAMDMLRKDLRLRRRERKAAHERHEATDVEPGDPHADDRLSWLRRQLSELDAGTARALDLRFRLNWTLHRIANAMHLRTGAVDGRINRAVSQLRAEAHKDDHD